MNFISSKYLISKYSRMKNKTKKNMKNMRNKKTKKTKKNKKYYSQKGGEEHMSELDPEIKKRQAAKQKKRLLLQTLTKLIIEKSKQNKIIGK